jgi:hypothetical protein
MDEVLEALVVAWQHVHDVIEPFIIPVFVGGGSAFIVCVTYDIVKALMIKKSPEGVAMARSLKRRKQYVRLLAAHLITEAFEEAEVKGLLGKYEKTQLYRTIGSRCHMPALLPAGSTTKFPDIGDLKDAIRSRIGKMRPPKGKPINRIEEVLLAKSK